MSQIVELEQNFKNDSQSERNIEFIKGMNNCYFYRNQNLGKAGPYADISSVEE